ncbi:hypothetical protein EDD86DRAFT_249374 [Gorgonomyces haynaldii]|nr:hypothetical protein EDD86DRAFT_249374 [Gorgonomyces haynaldii]
MLPLELFLKIGHFCDLTSYSRLLCASRKHYRLLSTIQCFFDPMNFMQLLHTKKSGLLLKLMDSPLFKSTDYTKHLELFECTRLELILVQSVELGLHLVVQRLLKDARVYSETMEAILMAVRKLQDPESVYEMYQMLQEWMSLEEGIWLAVRTHSHRLFDALWTDEQSDNVLKLTLTNALVSGNAHVASRLMEREIPNWKIAKVFFWLNTRTTYQVCKILLQNRVFNSQNDLFLGLGRAVIHGNKEIVQLLLEHVDPMQDIDLLLLNGLGYMHFDLCKYLLKHEKVNLPDLALLTDFDLLKTLVKRMGAGRVLSRHTSYKYPYFVSRIEIADYVQDLGASAHHLALLSAFSSPTHVFRHLYKHCHDLLHVCQEATLDNFQIVLQEARSEVIQVYMPLCKSLFDKNKCEHLRLLTSPQQPCGEMRDWQLKEYLSAHVHQLIPLAHHSTKQQRPLFDYDEIDDQEFEHLLQHPPQRQDFTSWLVSLFRRKPYQPLRQDDLFHVQEDAQLLSREQVNRLTTYQSIQIQLPSGSDPLNASSVNG